MKFSHSPDVVLWMDSRAYPVRCVYGNPIRTGYVHVEFLVHDVDGFECPPLTFTGRVAYCMQDFGPVDMSDVQWEGDDMVVRATIPWARVTMQIEDGRVDGRHHEKPRSATLVATWRFSGWQLEGEGGFPGVGGFPGNPPPPQDPPPPSRGGGVA